MSFPAVEIATFVASDAYKGDSRVLYPALALLKTIDGCNDIWYGTQIQDPSRFNLVIYWETLEHHQRYMDDKAEYAKLFAAITPAITEFLGLYHFHFQPEITPALDAPVTEIAGWVLAEGTDAAAFLARVRELGETIYRDMPADVARGGFELAMETDRRAAVVLGWQSLERFNEIVYANKQVVEIVADLKGKAELDLKHLKLTKFEKH
ncbi:hypothetical protein PsYK624_121110 [Phanerochaete sordida]|uniref:ABM domain-containing protein n=1 Tax=Phanerochaete sordida TaxID=48140 RepID=A0A9P3LIQ4_9APHY|nr:hypothetical protein PsYK624_121110 [Phanerochaete sordida]